EISYTSTSYASKWVPILNGVSSNDVDSNYDQSQHGHDTSVTAQPSDQCAYSVNEEEIWKYMGSKEFELMFLGGIDEEEISYTSTSYASKGDVDSNYDQPQHGHDTFLAAQPSDQCAYSLQSNQSQNSILLTGIADQYVRLLQLDSGHGLINTSEPDGRPVKKKQLRNGTLFGLMVPMVFVLKFPRRPQRIFKNIQIF
ncbi:hypothetical protein FRX31_024058, partial [Thalictrum thalictroides]